MLNISVGKQLLPKSSKKKGLVKLKNFTQKKSNYLYILTAKGITEKTKMTINFMKRKMKEYDDLKKIWTTLKTTLRATKKNNYV